MLRLLRWTGIRLLSREAIVEIARRKCEDEGWPWDEPVLVQEGIVHTCVTTNADKKGANVRIRISSRSGRVISAGIAGR